MRTVHRYGKARLQKDGNYEFEFNDQKMFREVFRETIGRGKELVDIELVISREEKSKSLSDLRYWKGPLLQSAFDCYRELGFNLGSKEDAEYLLKSVFYYEEVEIYPLGNIHRKPLSLKHISEEDLVNLTEKVREFINTELNGKLMSKQDWAHMLDTGELPENY